MNPMVVESTDLNQLSRQELAERLLPLLKAFRSAHEGEEGFAAGETVDRALRVMTINAQYDAEFGN